MSAPTTDVTDEYRTVVLQVFELATDLKQAAIARNERHKAELHEVAEKAASAIMSLEAEHKARVEAFEAELRSYRIALAKLQAELLEEQQKNRDIDLHFAAAEQRRISSLRS